MRACDWFTALVGFVGVIVGSVLTAVIQYFFWKKQHAIEAELAEQRDRQKTRLEITEHVRKLSTELVTLVRSGVSANVERQRVTAFLYAMREPITRYFSEQAVTDFESVKIMSDQAPPMATGPDDPMKIEQLRSTTELLVSRLYDESLTSTEVARQAPG